MVPVFLINTITGWKEPHRARHQFTFAAAKHVQTIFVAGNRIGLPGIKVSHPQENITLVEPSFPVDIRIRYRLPIINGLYQKWLYPKLKKMYPNVRVINFDFSGLHLKEYFSDYIYYCNDEFTANGKYTFKWIDQYIAHCEKKVASASAFCIGTADSLKQKLKTYNPESYLIPLGVSLKINHERQPVKKKSTDKITVGFMGVIAENIFSVELLNKIIEEPQFHLVLIGPIKNSFIRKIKKRNAVVIKGPLFGTELTNELEKIDVGIALYNLASVNAGTTPNKMWQYMALGKPVVVSDLPNLKGVTLPDKFIHILKDESRINELIKQAYESDTDELQRQRTNFALKNTWDHRFEDFRKIYNKRFPDETID